MGRVERSREIARKRSRRVKLRKLRAKFAATKDNGEKQEILAKVRKISPFAVIEEKAD